MVGICSSFNIFALLKKPRTYYGIRHILSALVMIPALLWLTVSLPFVYSAQLKTETSQQQAEKNDIPLPVTEEKAPTTVSEEYLHHTQQDPSPASGPQRERYGSFAVSAYCAFDGELLCPPPEM